MPARRYKSNTWWIRYTWLHWNSLGFSVFWKRTRCRAESRSCCKWGTLWAKMLKLCKSAPRLRGADKSPSHPASLSPAKQFRRVIGSKRYLERQVHQFAQYALKQEEAPALARPIADVCFFRFCGSGPFSYPPTAEVTRPCVDIYIYTLHRPTFTYWL